MEIQLRSCVHRAIKVLWLICGEPVNPWALRGCAGRHFWVTSIDTFISSKQDKDGKLNTDISDFPHKFPILWDFLAELDQMNEFYQNLSLTCFAVQCDGYSHDTLFSDLHHEDLVRHYLKSRPGVGKLWPTGWIPFWYSLQSKNVC